MKINVLTLFPAMFKAITEESILGKAQEKGILEIAVYNIRDYSLDKHKKTDDYPFGGSPGMVMTADPIFNALKDVGARGKKILYMSPRGRILDEEQIKAFSAMEELTILCGHYEGIDERILDYWDMEEVSIGDYILTGGELPAMVLIDAVARMVPQVLGSSNAHDEESIYSGLLEYPQYTKPRTYMDMEVPAVLVSGDHKKIHLWQFEQSLVLTKDRRPDLFAEFVKKAETLTKDEKKILEKVMENAGGQVEK